VKVIKDDRLVDESETGPMVVNESDEETQAEMIEIDDPTAKEDDLKGVKEISKKEEETLECVKGKVFKYELDADEEISYKKLKSHLDRVHPRIVVEQENNQSDKVAEDQEDMVPSPRKSSHSSPRLRGSPGPDILSSRSVYDSTAALDYIGLDERL
jgi:hypothetical protein